MQSKQTRHKLDWRAEENTEKMVKCELPQPLYTNYVLFELINQQKKSYLESLWFILRLWFLRCGLWKIAKQLKRMFFFALFPFINVLSQYVDDSDGSVEVAILGENWRRLLQ